MHENRRPPSDPLTATGCNPRENFTLPFLLTLVNPFRKRALVKPRLYSFDRLKGHRVGPVQLGYNVLRTPRLGSLLRGGYLLPEKVVLPVHSTFDLLAPFLLCSYMPLGCLQPFPGPACSFVFLDNHW